MLHGMKREMDVQNKGTSDRESDAHEIKELLHALKSMTKENTSCSTGKCGGKGRCLGVALLLAYLAGLGLAELTGSALLGFLVGVPLFIVLVLGLPGKRPDAHESTNDQPPRG